ncbi:MAG: hypothetical protein Q9168_007352, partial [Polycauliona sp. 1 TL-2023]
MFACQRLDILQRDIRIAESGPKDFTAEEVEFAVGGGDDDDAAVVGYYKREEGETNLS